MGKIDFANVSAAPDFRYEFWFLLNLRPAAAQWNPCLLNEIKVQEPTEVPITSPQVVSNHIKAFPPLRDVTSGSSFGDKEKVKDL
ncbi:hypothetical protein NQZ68_021046 [Dissostichus eleginoides]|nr:hypothetical protein NQZ68_021046 [Dissostichus eleginoides]